MPEWKRSRVGVETLTLAVMGCIVNGPGESKVANIGISLPGTGESPQVPRSLLTARCSRPFKEIYEELALGFQKLVDDYVAAKYPRPV